MIARGAVLAIALAGCGKGHGLLVQTEPGAELFIAQQSADCPTGTSCPITPPSPADRTMQGTQRDARRWLLPDTTPIIVDSSGGWLIEADGDQDEQLGALLAVQYDSANKPVKFGLAHDVTVPGSGRAIVKLELHASDGIQAWRTQAANDSEAPCVLVATGHSDAPYEAFLRHDDPDCDGATPECDKFAVFGSKPADEDALSCVVENMNGHCELGGGTCIDNMPGMPCGPPTDPWCLASTLCVPLSNCRATGESCLGPVIEAVATQPTPKLNCTFPLGSDMLPCPGQLPLHTTIDLSALGPCAEIKVASLAMSLTWDSTATLTSDSMISITSFDNNTCTADIVVTEPKVDALRAVGLIEVKTKGNPTVHHVIPIIINHAGAACGGPGDCDPLAVQTTADSLFSCRP